MSVKTCGKVRFRDRIAADLALAGLRRKDRATDHVEQRAYECPACRGWHLTSWPEMPS